MRKILDQFEVLSAAQLCSRPGKGMAILTRGRKTRSPIEIKLSARPEYLATSLGCTLRDSKTAVVSLALSM
jgi:hypothetical protein